MMCCDVTLADSRQGNVMKKEAEMQLKAGRFAGVEKAWLLAVQLIN